MNQHLQTVIDKRIERTAKALTKNRFDVHVMASREELISYLRETLPAGASCSVGGSMTLFEAGVIDFLEAGDYNYLDRYAEGADTKKVFHDALSCQFYFTSSNAITENGELYNIDGHGNRVAAIVYGPERVIVIAGYNKIVPDIEAAREYKRKVAAPANAQRLNKTTLPCFTTGSCTDCSSPDRFCSQELITYCQMNPGRITVILMNEQLGY